MSRSLWVVAAAVIAAVLLAVVAWQGPPWRANAWQRLASPGPLSDAHAHLEGDCAACHAAGRGPEAAKCAACHASNEHLLGRQPTAFHGDVGTCRECHAEHQGRGHRPTAMDHEALARVGVRQLDRATGDEERQARNRLRAWIDRPKAPPHPGITRLEASLDCAACHGTKDRHLGMFGTDCAECHRTDKWTVPGYRHPSARSTDCAECHKAPPSHLMGHFQMVSAKVAKKPHARVEQCYLCHQTTSWNDIKGVGWYKHH